MQEEHYETLRWQMVEEQLQARGIHDQRVLAAMRMVPRHLFVPPVSRAEAYQDTPAPIGHGQTISQPYIVALMLEALELTGQERVLEVGAGAGYQAGLLGHLAAEVYAVEIVPELARSARAVLSQLGSDNVTVVTANGSLGWQAEAPYDAIIVAAGSPTIPEALVNQLQEGGRFVALVGDMASQTLLRIRKRKGKALTEDFGSCAFVPLIGEKGWQADASSA